MRHKERRGLGWLLLIPVLVLPVAVYLSWKAPVVSFPPLEPRKEDTQKEAESTSEASPVAVTKTVPEAVSGPRLEETSSPRAQPSEEPTAPPSDESLTPKHHMEQPARPAEPEAPAQATGGQEVDWADIASQPGRWPAQTHLREAVDFPIRIEGKAAGSTRVPIGSGVKVLKIYPDGVEVAYAEYSVKLPFEQTTLGEQLLAEAADSPPNVPAKAEGPSQVASSSQKSAATTDDGKSLVPQKNWLKRPGDERTGLIELLKVLEHNSQPDSSLEISSHPEIFKGVTLMMPIREAAEKLGVGRELLPSKISITHPGLPFFFRTFPHKYSPIGAPEDHYNQLNIITDGNDRVVALHYVCENPRSKISGPQDNYFFTYNFITNRRKAASTHKVGSKVVPFNNDVLLITSWLYDERRDKCLELTRLYLPQRIADFLRHVLEAKLELED